MKFNRVFSLLATCACLATSSSLAMEQVHKDTMETINVVQSSLLETQLENVAAFVDQRKSRGLPVRMVFGAVNTECDRIADESVIFLDIASHDPEGRPHIQGSFNDLDFLEKVAKAVGPRLEEIIVDHETYKGAEWTLKHLQFFASMLEKNGAFIFPPAPYTARLCLTHKASTIEEIRAAFQELNHFKEDRLPTQYALPLGRLLEEELESSEVQKEFEKFQPLEQFIGLSGPQCYGIQRKLGMCEMWDPSNFKDPKKLKEKIARELLVKRIATVAKKDFYLPHLQKILEQTFQNVTLKENAPLPRMTGENEIVSLLFYAKNPR